MNNIYPSILEKFTALNIDIYHYEDIVRCYALAKLNIDHSRKPDYADGIHTADFAAEVSRYQLLAPDENPYYDIPSGLSPHRHLKSHLTLSMISPDISSDLLQRRCYILRKPVVICFNILIICRALNTIGAAQFQFER